MKYLILLIFLCSCASFTEKVEEHNNQLNCEPAESEGCAGWLPKEQI
tara:strand:+ start:230 stop:370 length:141 start_codon:yes stop_codon:yes gene_type:complete